jgi:hypothetical protein
MPEENKSNLFRNIILFMILILGLILYSKASDIRKWWKESVLKSSTPQVATLKPEPSEAHPVESDLQLDSKAAAVACGKVLKLDKAAFVKLDLVNRFSQLAADSGITEEEAKAMGAKDLDEQEFEAYSFGYITWDKSKDVSRASFDKMVVDAVNSVDESKLSPAERIQLDPFMVKFRRMMVKAFDLGRQDAKKSPCPF